MSVCCGFLAASSQNSTHRIMAKLAGAGTLYLPSLPQQSPMAQVGYGAQLGGAFYLAKPLAFNINAGITPSAQYPDTDSTRGSYQLVEANTQIHLDIVKLFAAETVPVSLYVESGIGVAAISGKTTLYAPATAGFRFKINKKTELRLDATYKYALTANQPSFVTVGAGVAFAVTQARKKDDDTKTTPPPTPVAKANTFNTGELNKATAENPKTPAEKSATEKTPAEKNAAGNKSNGNASGGSTAGKASGNVSGESTSGKSATQPASSTSSATPNGGGKSPATKPSAGGEKSATGTTPATTTGTKPKPSKANGNKIEADDDVLTQTENATVGVGEASEEEALLTPPSQGATNVGTLARNISHTDSVFLENAKMSIKFTPSGEELLPESYATLDKIAELMAKYPNSRLHVSGHCDDMDKLTKDEILILSVRRAYNVKYYLVNQKHIKLSRITSDGYGSDMPLKDGSPQNARVEFDLFNK